MDGSLTRRIAALEARNDIVDLIVAYFERVDARDIEGLVELFAPAAELLAPGHPLRGHAEIRAFYTWRLPQFEFTNHYPHAETVIFEDENLARGRITGHAEHGIANTCNLAALRYQDRYVRTEDRWCFSFRRIETVYFLPWDNFTGRYP